MATFELLLAGGGVAKWDGTDGVNAAERYVDAHREAAVIAWRVPRVQFVPGFDARRDRIEQ